MVTEELTKLLQQIRVVINDYPGLYCPIVDNLKKLERQICRFLGVP